MGKPYLLNWKTKFSLAMKFYCIAKISRMEGSLVITKTISRSKVETLYYNNPRTGADGY